MSSHHQLEWKDYFLVNITDQSDDFHLVTSFSSFHDYDVFVLETKDDFDCLEFIYS